MDIRMYRSAKPLQRNAERFWTFLAKRIAAKPDPAAFP
jgi:hypothetical protein